MVDRPPEGRSQASSQASSGSGSATFHMTPDEFRRAGREVVEWIARYMETVEERPVRSRVLPGEIRRGLPLTPPAEPEPFEEVLADLETVILPGITHWQSPGFFAYFPANASGPSILGELLSAALGVNGMSWATSPAVTELETHVLDWMIDLTGLPERFRSGGPGGGVIQDSASSATLCATLAARERAGGAAKLGDLCVYTSEQAHSSVEKGARIAGFRSEQVRLIGCDSTYAMDAAALRRAVLSDVESGRRPCLIVATVGTTSTLAVDPVPAIAGVAGQSGAWLHVDAAMAGSAAVCPELRGLFEGVESADSYCFNPHKWLLTNFDCDCFYVAERAPLLDALAVMPEYLRTAESEAGEVIDYRDWQIPLGRRFRALKLWMVLRHYGADGLRAHVRRHVALAQRLAERVGSHPSLELAAPPALNLVCFRHVGGDADTEALLGQLNDSGRVLLTHTRLDGRFVVRCCVGGTWTEERHVDALWELIERLA